MPRSDAQTRALFDRWAATYDDVQSGDGPLAGYAASLREAAAMLPVGAGAHVLDIGIGTGAFAALIAGRGALISGIDVSEGMLAACRAARPEFALALGSFTPIPYPDERFDAVISSFAFHEVASSSRPNACAEIARVLRRGGIVCLLDIVFASTAATADARRAFGVSWDDDEDYALVADLDTLLRQASFADLSWRHTAPCHWVVVGRRSR